MRHSRAPPVVLVVEDEWLVRNMIAEALRSAGCNVIESATAEEAVAYARAGGGVDVVLTDIQLPGALNGWDVAEQFRALREDVPVIYTSGNAADRSRRVPDSVFFQKPYDVAAVVRACWPHDVSVFEFGGDRSGMQHYFLHIRDGDVRTLDPEGSLYADLDSAKAEAIQGARELISECVLTGTSMRVHRIFEIADAQGQVLATIPFTDAIGK